MLSASLYGASIAEIVTHLFLSEGTVRNHLSTAIQKLGAQNRIEAARLTEQKDGYKQSGESSLFRKVERQQVIGQLIQTASDNQHAHQNQKHPSNQRDKTCKPAHVAHKRMNAIHQQPHQ